MARLTQIEVRESDITYSNQRDWFFHTTAHHVRELLLHFLPNDFVLDGSSKFSAIFGQRPHDKEKCYTVLGVTVCHIDNFDVESYMLRPVDEQQELILAELTRSMLIVSRSDPAVIEKAADAVRHVRFAAEINVRKLGRSTPNREFRVEVFRRLGPNIGEAWEARINSRHGVEVLVDAITELPGYIDRTSQFSRSRWNGNVYQIVDSHSRKLQYELDLSQFL